MPMTASLTDKLGQLHSWVCGLNDDEINEKLGGIPLKHVQTEVQAGCVIRYPFTHLGQGLLIPHGHEPLPKLRRVRALGFGG